MDPITSGERFTLTLWFTQDPAHSEDTRLLVQLAGGGGMGWWRVTPKSHTPGGMDGWAGYDSHAQQVPLLAPAFCCEGCRGYASLACRPAAGPVPRSLGLPASMWRLPDGTDLRLCRLGMAGFALVWQGQVLHSTEGLPEDGTTGSSQLQLQLAVQPGVLQAWLNWQSPPRPHRPDGTEGGTSGGGACGVAAPAVEQGGCAEANPAEATVAQLVAGIEFGSVQDAVLAVQHFLQDWCGSSYMRERVCRAHLCEAPAVQPPTPSCSWLCSCQMQQLNGCSTGELPFTAADLQGAAQATMRTLAKQQAMLEVLRPRWLQVGALFLLE